MTTLATLTTRLLQILGDNTTTPSRYSSSLTNEAFRQAAGEYSIALPLITTATHTVTSAGRVQAIASLARLTVITQILYPWIDDSAEPAPLQQYYLYFSAGAPVVYIGGPGIPAVGEKLRITYAATHTVDDLDAAAACTVPAAHFNLLLQGAAGHAAILRSSAIVEAYANRDPDANQVHAFGVEMLAAFRAQLHTLRIQSSRQPLPGSGFKLDPWDGK
jgi:hypothetical protein